MSRLVFANEGGVWLPMWLDYNGFLTYQPPFAYTEIVWVDNIGFISETFNGYVRELFVDLNACMLYPDGITVRYCEIGELAGRSYYNFFLPVGLNINWPQYHNVAAKWQYYQANFVLPRTQLMHFEYAKQQVITTFALASQEAVQKQKLLEAELADLKKKFEKIEEVNHELKVKLDKEEIEHKLAQVEDKQEEISDTQDEIQDEQEELPDTPDEIQDKQEKVLTEKELTTEVPKQKQQKPHKQKPHKQKQQKHKKEIKAPPSKDKSIELFNIIESGVNLSEEEQKLLPKFAKKYNDQWQTFLMLAIKLNMAHGIIIELINKSDILQCDHNNETVLHYWARYYNPESLNYFELLCSKFVAAFTPYKNKCLLDEIGKQSIQDGNTFLHVLLQHESEEKVEKAVSQLFNLKQAKLFYGVILFENNARQTVSYMLDQKKEDWLRVRKLIYSVLADVVFDLSEKQKADTRPFFGTGTTFFSSTGRDVVFDLVDKDSKESYYKLVNILESRYMLQYYIASGFSIREKSSKDKAKFSKIHSKVIRYFHHGDLHEKPYKNTQTVFGYLLDFICKADDLELEYKVSSSPFLGVFSTLPPSETIVGKKLALYIESPPELRVESKLISDFKSFVKIDDINMREAMNGAIQGQNLTLVKFLVESCGAIISDDFIFFALLSDLEKDLSISEYLLDKHKSKTCLEAKESVSAALFLQSVLKLQSVVKTLFLIRCGFNPAAIGENSQNILQALLEGIREGKVSLGGAFELCEAVFFNPEHVEKLLNHKDKSKMTALKYVALCGSPAKPPLDDLIALFKLLFDNGAKYQDLSNKEGQNILHYALFKNDLGLLNLFVSYIAESELLELLTKTDENGKDILDVARTKVEARRLNPEILSRLEILKSNKKIGQRLQA